MESRNEPTSTSYICKVQNSVVTTAVTCISHADTSGETKRPIRVVISGTVLYMDPEDGIDVGDVVEVPSSATRATRRYIVAESKKLVLSDVSSADIIAVSLAATPEERQDHMTVR